MKKIITLILVAMLSLTACIGMVGCQNDKYITVGYTDYPPMNYEKDGELVGFDTELAEKVFTELGYKVRFKLIIWENKYTELNGGSIDCIWNGFTSNGDDDGVPRSQSVDFTYNYMQNAQCILRKNTTADVTDPSAFDGKSIAFENSSAAESLVEGYAENNNAMPTGKASQMDAITALNNGTADFAVVDILLAQSIVNQPDYSSLVINEGIEIPIEYYAVGFKKGSELTAKVNEQLEKLLENGFIKSLAEEYNLATAYITDYSSQK